MNVICHLYLIFQVLHVDARAKSECFDYYFSLFVRSLDQYAQINRQERADSICTDVELRVQKLSNERSSRNEL